MIARPGQLDQADALWGLDLTRSRTRWAILRAGGWGGYVDEVVGWYDSISPVTGVTLRVPIYRFVERRDLRAECRHGLPACYRLGCPETGRCEGAAAEGQPQPDVVAMAYGRRG